MKRNLLRVSGLLACIACISAMSSCSTDANYDLSNIDTNARISVNNLVVPINIDAMKLETMLDVKEGDEIKKSEDGYYIDKKSTSDFSSGEISLAAVTVPATSSTATPTVPIFNNPTGQAVAGTWYTDVDVKNIKFQATARGIDDKVTDIYSVKMKNQGSNVSLSLDLNCIKGVFRTVEISELQIKLFDGLTVADPSKGTISNNTITITDLQPTSQDNLTFNVSFRITDLDLKKAGAVFDKDAHTLNVDNAFSAVAKVKATTLDGSNTERVANFTNNISAMPISNVSGSINYNVVKPSIAPINLSNIPDMLNQSGTNIILDNPQLKLILKNPIAQYTKCLASGFSLTGYKTCSVPERIPLENGNETFLLAPTDPKSEGTYTYRAFPDFKYVVAHDGTLSEDKPSIPKQITIDATPVATGEVTNIPLGISLGKVTGSWEFFTPLALTKDSKIVYKKVWDNWQDPDLDYLTASDAVISLHVKNDIPLALNKISFSLDGESGGISGEKDVNIAAGGESDVEIPISGNPVSKITGATIKIDINGAGSTLKPSQTISISNVKAKVNGYYEKKL